MLGHTDITLEATAYGLILGLRAIALLLCGALYTVAVDPDEMLGLLRRVSPRSALTATIATRMVPVLLRDSRRLADAQRCRPGPPPSRATLLRAASAGVFDRALDVAAALEVRGYGLVRHPPAARRRPLSRHDLAFGAAAGALAGWAIAARAAGWAPTATYPSLHVATGPAALAVAGGAAGARPAPVRRLARGGAMSVLEIERLSYRYPSGTLALREVSLSVAPGEIVVVAGASGSGKSTLLRAAAGLVPHFHGGEIAGRVLVDGLDTREHGPAALSRSVGTVFQDPETQLVMGSVRAELAFAAENRGEPAASVARAVEETALALGIAHLLDRETDDLSGGEQQRVALAAALTARPPLLVLDEPTSQLDPVAGDELIGLLRRLAEDLDAAVLIAEHRLERCLPAADRAIAMAGGQIVLDGTPDRAARVRGRPGSGARHARRRAPASSRRTAGARRAPRASGAPGARSGARADGATHGAPGTGARDGAPVAIGSGTSSAAAPRSCAGWSSPSGPASAWR